MTRRPRGAAGLPPGRAARYGERMDLSPLVWTGAVAVTLFAGFVKGAVGFAMPLIMISGLSAFMDPLLAVAAIILPITFTNALQTFRTGWQPAAEAVAEHWRYIAVVCVAILLFAQLVPSLDPRAFLLILGVPTVALSAIQLAGWRLWVPPHRRRAAEWSVGLASGALGDSVGRNTGAGGGAGRPAGAEPVEESSRPRHGALLAGSRPA